MKSIIYLLIVIVTTPAFSQDDQCKDILDGFYNKTQSFNSGNYTQDVKNWLIRDLKSFIQNSSDANFGIKIPIEGIPIGFNMGTSDATYNKLHDFLNSGSSSYITTSFANFVSSQIINPIVVNKWGECMADRREQKGIAAIVEGERDSIFFMKIRWYGVANVFKAVVKNIWVHGANYDTTSLKSGDTIAADWISIPFVRTGSAGVYISINTIDEIGSISKSINPLNIQKSSRQRCIEGDDVGCVEYKNELQTKLGPPPNPGVRPETGFDYQRMQRIIQCYENRIIAIMQVKSLCQNYGSNSQACLEAKSRLLYSDTDRCDNINAERIFLGR